MTDFQLRDPLHGITLEMILNQLIQQYGWAELAKRIPIRCFTNQPSLKSSLKFLRRTPWARTICHTALVYGASEQIEVEELYLASIAK